MYTYIPSLPAHSQVITGHWAELPVLYSRFSLAIYFTCGSVGFPVGTSSKEPACQCRRHKRRRFSPWVGKIPWRRAWRPTPVFWFPWWCNGKESTRNAGDPEWVPGSGISPGGRNDVGHLFMCFFGLLYVFGETSTQVFCLFLTGFCVLLLLSFMSFLYISEINHWLVALFANIFSCSTDPLFTF